MRAGPRGARAGASACPISIDTYKAEVAARGARRGRRRSSTTSAACGTIRTLGARRRRARRAARPDAHARPARATCIAQADVRRRRRRGARRAARERSRAREAAASRASALIVDPGPRLRQAGASTAARCWRGLDEFAELGRPLLVGPSRKSFLTRRARATASGRRPRLGDRGRGHRRRPARRAHRPRPRRAARWCRWSASPTRFGSDASADRPT